MLFNKTPGDPRYHYKLYERITCGNQHLILRRAENKFSQSQRLLRVIKKGFLDIKDEERTFLREMAILRTMDHPNIIKIFEYFEDEKYYYLFTEYSVYKK